MKYRCANNVKPHMCFRKIFIKNKLMAFYENTFKNGFSIDVFVVHLMNFTRGASNCGGHCKTTVKIRG